MNNLTTDIGYISLNKYGEELCGDHVEITGHGDGSAVIVLADGLGSGVKANILSTLTAKILSTMVANRLPVEDCVHTVAATLPICKVREIAYSTFSIISITDNREAEIIQYDNPQVILLRGGRNFDYPQEQEEIGGKLIYKARIALEEGDLFVVLSDGAIHAGVGITLNFGWQREDIIHFLEGSYDAGCSARAVSTLLAGRCNDLYGGHPRDDTTVCTLKIRRRSPVNLMIGPPVERADEAEMLAGFFGRRGRYIVCGGTTAKIAAAWLGKRVEVGAPVYVDPDIPPTARIEGVDLVTEGVVTISRVLEYAKDCLGANSRYEEWRKNTDGASLIARMLFEEATDVNFYIGRAANPAHQNPGLPINLNIKLRLVAELAEALRKMGKKVEEIEY